MRRLLHTTAQINIGLTFNGIVIQLGKISEEDICLFLAKQHFRVNPKHLCPDLPRIPIYQDLGYSMLQHFYLIKNNVCVVILVYN